ncbi:MAG TPA: HEAT repeat domain-containing protein, partial [Blastocatellia bacterium]|nr:HEAT repeat domain-containing protein [Blastocatellia bacterium]
NTHDAAISALMQLNWQRPRKEAMLPLLPWLTNPNWASARLKPMRERLVQQMTQIQIPEAIPYLIAALSDGDRYFRVTVARSLAEYDASQAGADLRKAALEAAPGWKPTFAQALVKCGALRDGEKIVYLELYASKIKRAEDVTLMQDGTGLHYILRDDDCESLDCIIGWQLSEERNAPVQLASALIERAKALQLTNPTLANNLLLIVQRWPVPAVFQNIAERIGDGTADHRAIGQALRHREKFRASAGLELQALTKRGGRAAGIAAALLGDQSIEKEILRGNDREAQTALLACGRLLREPLSVEPVGALYAVKNNSLLKKAVDLYLESEDSPEARKRIWAEHRNEALILGARHSFDPQPSGAVSKWEEKLREEVKRPNGSEEIFAMSVGASANPTISIRVRRGKAIVIKSKDGSREEFRELTDNELSEVRELFEETDFNKLTSRIWVPAKTSLALGPSDETEFIHLTASGGHRVYALLPRPFKKEINAHQKLYALFSRLEKADDFRLRYKLADLIEGLDVLLADDSKFVKTVCQQGSEMRVMIGKPGTDEDSHWFALSSNGLGGETDEPAACRILGDRKELGDQIGGWLEGKYAAWKVRTGGNTIQSGYLSGDSNYSPGLWKVHSGKAPERISEISLNWLLVTGGRWVIGSQTGENRQQTLRRFDLRTNRMLPTNVLSADYVQPISEIPAMGKVLIACHKDHYSQPTKTDFYLLDPTTGSAQPVKGEFRPLQHQTFRPLQPVMGSTEFWAAIPDEHLNRTQVGTYDAQRFEFKPLLELPALKFDSMRMWVNEQDKSANRIFISYNGHLLSLPAPNLPETK